MTNYIDYLESLSRKQLMVLLARQHREQTQGIAIVGMGCRLPGGIDDPRAWWTALREGRVLATESAGVPTDSLGRPRWNLEAPDVAPLAARLRQGAYLADVDLFDADYFGIPEQEALHMDPQQRLLLEVAVQALADANLPRHRVRRHTVGVFVGAGPVEYPYAWLRSGLRTEGALSGHMSSGSAPSALSGRIAQTLGVSGPAVTVDTASSSMLVAVHLAAQALRRRECDVALVGVCNLLLSPFTTGILDRAGMLSPTGRSRPFSAHADGHVRGEGCGVVVLKRQADASTAGDLPYALLRGSALHAQGDRPSITVTSARGQRAVIERALRDAGVQPAEVSYVETQANGSRLGGQIEAEALAQAYERTSPDAPPLYLGSCKANIGYLEAASGAPGLMKAALTLAHGELPPQPGEADPDPDIPWRSTALRLAAKPQPWPSHDTRRAGVSGVGFCGTAAHAVLESAPERPAARPAAAGPCLLVLSAHHADALAATARRLYDRLHETADWTPVGVCRTLAEGRDHPAVRHAAVVYDRAGLLQELARVAAAGSGAGARAADLAPGAAGQVFVDLSAGAAGPGAAGFDPAAGDSAAPEPVSSGLASPSAADLGAAHPDQPGVRHRPAGPGAPGALQDVRTAADESTRAALAAPGFEPLQRWVNARFTALTNADMSEKGQRVGRAAADFGAGARRGRLPLAWALGWLDLLASLGLEVAGGRCTGPERHLLAEVLTGRRTADEVCAGRASAPGGAAGVPSGWELSEDAAAVTVRRRGGGGAVNVRPAGLDPAGWLALLAHRHTAGAALAFAALWPDGPSRPPMCRLPGPALVGRRFWPDHNTWR